MLTGPISVAPSILRLVHVGQHSSGIAPTTELCRHAYDAVCVALHGGIAVQYIQSMAEVRKAVGCDNRCEGGYYKQYT